MSTEKVIPVRTLVERYAEAEIPTARGTLRHVVFREKRTGKEHVAIIAGEVKAMEGVPVRIHSECLTSEVLGSLKCDCRARCLRRLICQRRNATIRLKTPTHAQARLASSSLARGVGMGLAR